MAQKIRFVLLFIFTAWCFPAEAQLSFKVDSLRNFCFGDIGTERSWENKLLYSRGPDVLIYGTLSNIGTTPIILQMEEWGEDSFIQYKTLDLSVSYHFKTDYCFAPDPLFVSDIFSYPFWDGMMPPGNRIQIDGRKIFYSILEPGEAIALAFETLAVPENISGPIQDIDSIDSKQYRKKRRFQERFFKAIESSLSVRPSVRDSLYDIAFYEHVINCISEQSKKESGYDPESSIPLVFLDKRPTYKDGGAHGFYQWLKKEMGEAQTQMTIRECRVLISFVVSKEGKVIYSRISGTHPPQDIEEVGRLLNRILPNSPEWGAGELHGRKVDSRISLMISIDHDGNVDEISILAPRYLNDNP